MAVSLLFFVCPETRVASRAIAVCFSHSRTARCQQRALFSFSLIVGQSAKGRFPGMLRGKEVAAPSAASSALTDIKTLASRVPAAASEVCAWSSVAINGLLESGDEVGVRKHCVSPLALRGGCASGRRRESGHRINCAPQLHGRLAGRNAAVDAFFSALSAAASGSSPSEDAVGKSGKRKSADSAAPKAAAKKAKKVKGASATQHLPRHAAALVENAEARLAASRRQRTRAIRPSRTWCFVHAA